MIFKTKQKQTDHTFTREFLDYQREFLPNPLHEYDSRTNDLRNMYLELQEDRHTWQALALKFGGQDALDEYDAKLLKVAAAKEPQDIPF